MLAGRDPKSTRSETGYHLEHPWLGHLSFDPFIVCAENPRAKEQCMKGSKSLHHKTISSVRSKDPHE